MNLPPNFHPILVDRLVTHLYEGDYHMAPDNLKTAVLTQAYFSFRNATFIPAPTPAVTALVDTHYDMFNLHMYAVAEELDYPALEPTAFSKLATVLTMFRRRTPLELKSVIDAIFAPPGSPARICKDENGSPHNIAVTSVMAHDLLDWTGVKGDARRKDFSDAMQGAEYAEFWTAYHATKEQNMGIVQKAVARKEAADKRAKAAEEPKAGKEAATAALAVKGSPSKASAGVSKKVRKGPKYKHVVRPDGNGDGDVEME